MSTYGIVQVIIFTGIIGILLYLSAVYYLVCNLKYIRKNIYKNYYETEEYLAKFIVSDKCMEVLNTPYTLTLNYGSEAAFGFKMKTIILDKHNGNISIKDLNSTRCFIISNNLNSTEIRFIENELMEFKKKHEIWRKNEEVIRRNKS